MKLLRQIVSHVIVAACAALVGFLLGEAPLKAKMHHYTMLLNRGTYSGNQDLEDFMRVQIYMDAVRGFIRDKNMLNSFPHKAIESNVIRLHPPTKDGISVDELYLRFQELMEE